MSQPENVLAKYRTYSYHHILIAVDNDAAADYITDATELGVFRRIGSAQGVFAPDDPERLDQVDPATGRVEKAQIGNYVVILNGLIDTQYVIQDAEWFTATAAHTDQNDRFNSVAVEGKFTVQEPGGIRFMNALNSAADALRSDPTGLIWILKTIFVGHRDDPSGGQVTDHITDIKPLRFIIYNVTGTFSTSGGLYNVDFAGASNGASRFPQFSRGAEQVTLTPADTKLETALTQLATDMTDLSNANRDCLVEALIDAYGNPVNDKDGTTLEELRAVNYQIVVEEPYNTPDYVVNAWDCRQTDRGTTESKGALTFGRSCTVEQAIRHIMDRSDKVRTDRTEGAEDGVKYIYKIQSQITMVGKDDEGARTNDEEQGFDTVLVKYFVRRFAQVTNQTIEKVLGRDPQSSGEGEISQDIIDQNTITFDYFFSGKNIDILDFDIKMEMGLAFMQTIATSNTLPTQAEQIKGKAPRNIVFTNTQENQGNSERDGKSPPQIVVRNRTPIFPSTKVKDITLRNAGNPKSAGLFQAYLSRHAALESLDANVTILGNPYLLSTTNRQASDVASRRNSQGDLSPEARQQNVLINWDKIPGLAKVNIFMPVTNEIPSSNPRFEREPFWYTGYYYIYGIQHKFNEGEFTQNLQMLSLINESAIEEQNKQGLECGIPDKETSSDDNEQTATDKDDSVGSAAEAVEQTGRTNESDVEECEPGSGEAA